jgi:hypothetical protein
MVIQLNSNVYKVTIQAHGKHLTFRVPCADKVTAIKEVNKWLKGLQSKALLSKMY